MNPEEQKIVLVVDGSAPKSTVDELLKKFGDDVTVMTPEQAERQFPESMEKFQQPLANQVQVYGPNQGRLRSLDRKMSKKAKLQDLQRRAFLGE